VNRVSENTSRYPGRVSIEIEGWKVLDGIRDLVREFNADIVDVEAGPDSLTLYVEVRESWKDGGVRSARKGGGSIVLTLPREALEASGLDTGQMALHGRTNEIHITSHSSPEAPR